VTNVDCGAENVHNRVTEIGHTDPIDNATVPCHACGQDYQVCWPGLLGLSQETTCFVTSRYLEGRDKFDDFIVHEAAHVFHNWKREYAGLSFTRTKEWLLPIEFRKRETFAYSCEVYSRIVEQGGTPKQRN
jgi:hypothetical protein